MASDAVSSDVVSQNILNRLISIEKSVEEIREHMVDIDVLLSEEDKLLLSDSLAHEKKGLLHTFEDIENVRNTA